MFERTYSNVKVWKTATSKRGECLAARCDSAPDREIYMDICGPALPEGVNSYMFGNKVFFVVRWDNINDEEKEFLNNGSINLCMLVSSCVNFAVQFDGNGWGDVFPTLYHCMDFMNDENAVVEELVFIFADKQTGEIVGDRVVKLKDPLPKLFMMINSLTHKKCHLDEKDLLLLADSVVTPNKDWCDLVYDDVWSQFANESRKMRAMEPSDVQGGIYIDIDADNQIVKLYKK